MSKLRKLIVVALICATGALMAGCLSVTHSGSTTTVAFWERTTKTIDHWYRTDCHENINCTFFNIRANLCNWLRDGDPAGFLVCYAGTDATNQAMGYSFVYYLVDWEQNRYGCLAISNLDTVGWEHISNGHDGCTH